MALMNAAEFMRLNVTHCRIELWRGVVHERPFLDAASGSALCRLFVEVCRPDIQEGNLVGLTGGTGFQLEHDPDTVLAPNGAFFMNDGLHGADPDAYLTLAPDIIIEARLPDMQEEELAMRAGWWLHFGTRTVWIADAGGQTLTVCATGKEAIIFHIEDVFDCGDVLPGFTLPVKRLFRDVK